MILETHQVNNNNDDNLNADIQCNSFIIEEGCSIGFVPDNPNNLFAFPNGKDVLDDPLFYNNGNSIGNEADAENDVVPDNDTYGVIYDRTDDKNPPSLPPESNMRYIHSIIGEVNKDFRFWTNISNVKSAHNYNDNTYDDTVLNQVNSNNNNNTTIILDKHNTISDIKREVNEEYMFWKTDKNYDDNFSHNNNHNRDDENNYDDHYGIHSEFINSNPSMIPNNGERVVLLSSVSQVVKNNNEAKNDEMKYGHQYDNNYDGEYVDITSDTKLEWTLKKYQIDNANAFVDTVKLEWILKKYQVDNVTKLDWFLKWYQDSSTSNGCSDDYEDKYVDITSTNKVECLEWYMQKY